MNLQEKLQTDLQEKFAFNFTTAAAVFTSCAHLTRPFNSPPDPMIEFENPSDVLVLTD